MKNKIYMKLATSGAGRIALHIIAANIDWKLRKHLAGIRREMATV
jgi:hypothetical protein